MDRSKENQIQDEIDRFLNYEMTPEEEAEFMNRMEKDASLKEKVSTTEESRNGTAESDRKEAP